MFSGTLAYTDTGRLYATTGPDGIRYVGKPTPDVDRAWEELIGGTAPCIYREEFPVY